MSIVKSIRPGAFPSFDNQNSGGHDGHGGNEPPTMPPTDYVTHKEFQEVRAEITERLARVESRLDQTASKADLFELRADMHEGFSTMIKWVVGSAIGLGVAGITVMTFVLNNASPKQTVQPQQPPIIINIPTPQAGPPPPQSK